MATSFVLNCLLSMEAFLYAVADLYAHMSVRELREVTCVIVCMMTADLTFTRGFILCCIFCGEPVCGENDYLRENSCEKTILSCHTSLSD